jgi:hypothetical protein
VPETHQMFLFISLVNVHCSQKLHLRYLVLAFLLTSSVTFSKLFNQSVRKCLHLQNEIKSSIYSLL